MFKKIGISALVVIGLLGIFYIVSYGILENMMSLQAYREIRMNYMLLCTKYIAFGIVLGIPLIVRLVKKEGRWTIDFYYLLLPVILLVLLVIPMISENYTGQRYFFIDGFIHYMFPLICIAFGYSIPLLIQKEEQDLI